MDQEIIPPGKELVPPGKTAGRPRTVRPVAAVSVFP
jgi:hypothetical protein